MQNHSRARSQSLLQKVASRRPTASGIEKFINVLFNKTGYTRELRGSISHTRPMPDLAGRPRAAIG